MGNRAERAAIAAQTVEILERGRYVAPDGGEVDFSGDLASAVSGATLYAPGDLTYDAAPLGASIAGDMAIDVVNETSFSGARALLATGAAEVCCLNFASAKNPGGGFLGGSQAQEEALARASGLTACLKAAPAYYDSNRRAPNALYTDHIIFAPAVPVFRDDHDALLSSHWLCSIVTAPAPNAGAIRQNTPELSEQIEATLERRAGMVLEACRRHGVRHLVLGAWGCGVFRNDSRQVAAVFAAHLQAPHFAAAFDHVRFSVLDRPEGPTFTAFHDQFCAE
ncbi:MAG: TIGR02452 family protein [Neomegalonema sp.]|nr:TIGR02452 family protein [Neomegalonema sp.]